MNFSSLTSSKSSRGGTGCHIGTALIFLCSCDLTLDDHPPGKPAGANDASPANADASVVDAGVPDVGPVTNEVVPVPPTPCALELASGVTLDGPPLPGDDLVISLAELPSELDPSSLRYELLRAPAGSRVYLEPTSTREGGPALRMVRRYQWLLSSPYDLMHPPEVPGPDLVGTYVIELGGEGGSGAEPDRCFVNVRPPHALYVELTWDQPVADLDLVMTMKDPQGRFCLMANYPGDDYSGLGEVCRDAYPYPPLICSANSCLAGGERPDYDGDGTHGSVGDPLLWRDEVQGFGPEMISIEVTSPGEYLLGFQAKGFGYSGDVVGSAKIFAFGQLRGQLSQMADEGGDWRELAVLRWPAEPGGELCLLDLTSDVETCLPVPQCAPTASCTQCLGDETCGPGSVCDPDLAQCVPDLALCHNDDMCPGDEVCVPATDVCAMPGCVEAAGCADPVYACRPDTLMCVQPPPFCDEENEPNNDRASATAIEGDRHSDTLCRDDVDYLLIRGQSGTRLKASVSFQLEFVDVNVRLLDSAGAVLAEERLAYDGWVTLSTPVTEEEDYYLEIRDVMSIEDSNSYTVTLTHQALEVCDEPGEPNDLFEQAENSVLTAGSHSFVGCGEEDTDYHLITIPPESRLYIRLISDSTLGNLQPSVHDSVTGEWVNESFSYGWQTSDGSRWCMVTNEAITEYSVVLEALFYHLTRDVLPYVVEIFFEELPPCLDGYEPNDTPQQAVPITPGLLDSSICDESDLDYYEIELEQRGTIRAVLFPARIPFHRIAMTVLTQEGANLAGGEDEDGLSSMVLEALQQPAGVYHLRLGPSTEVRQPYTLYVELMY